MDGLDFLLLRRIDYVQHDPLGSGHDLHLRNFYSTFLGHIIYHSWKLRLASHLLMVKSRHVNVRLVGSQRSHRVH